MPVESSTDLFHPLGGKLSETLSEALTANGSDLFAKSLALTAQPTFSGWNPNLKREDPLSTGGDGDYRYRRARPICQIVLDNDNGTRLADLRSNRWVQVHQKDIPTSDHRPSTSKLDHSGSREGAIASER